MRCFPLIFFLLAGCGGVKTYLHPFDELSKPLKSVHLEVGEKRIAIQDSRGLTSIAGGYFWGLIADDPDIARITYETDGATTRTYLTGATTGQTRIYYINRVVFGSPELGINEYGENGAYYKANSPSFLVEVK